MGDWKESIIGRLCKCMGLGDESGAAIRRRATSGH